MFFTDWKKGEVGERGGLLQNLPATMRRVHSGLLEDVRCVPEHEVHQLQHRLSVMTTRSTKVMRVEVRLGNHSILVLPDPHRREDLLHLQ